MNTTAALFCNGSEFMLVCVEEDPNESASASVVARGYRYIGLVAIVDGEPRVSIELGCEAQMVFAVAAFAEWIGPRLKAHQLAEPAKQADLRG